VAGVHRLQHVERLGAAHLAHDDPVRAHPQRVAHQVALRHGAGLVAPAIAAAETLPVTELMRHFRELVVRARTGRLRSSEVTAGTITVTSLGDRSVDWVYPIIQPPQVAMVGFGQMTRRPWVEGEAVVARRVITATLAGDHRVSDGRRGAVFLEKLAECLQTPEQL